MEFLLQRRRYKLRSRVWEAVIREPRSASAVMKSRGVQGPGKSGQIATS